MPCSNKHGVNCGDDLPVLEQTDDVDASFDNNIAIILHSI